MTRTVLVSGATGLIGAAFVESAQARGWKVRALTRERPPPGGAEAVRWNPAARELAPDALDGVDAVVHLAGESIGEGRWTEAKKRRILDSRVDSTETLARAMERTAKIPPVFVSASAVGYYGDRGPEILTETSTPGTGFLADVCRRWEAAAAPIAATGSRLVYLRTSGVISARGGLLAKLLPIFRSGAGGPLGSGEQYLSWIALSDLVNVLHRVLDDGAFSGPLNAVAPEPVTNRELAKILGRVLHRPAFLPAPAFALRLMLGADLANELLLSSTRAVPARLTAAGFRFESRTLEPAIRRALTPG